MDVGQSGWKQKILNRVRGRNGAWNEHVNGMMDTRVANIAQNGTLIGRPPDRPSTRWRGSWQSISGEH